jgi:hypothetical protein
MADSTLMYTSIDTTISMQTFHDIFLTYNKDIPNNFPGELFLTMLEIIMNNNVFTFGDSHWVQHQGTAVDTPAALLYSLLMFGYHENTQMSLYLLHMA